MNDHFGTVRASLARPPSLDAFAWVCRAVDAAWSEDAERTQEQILPYALSHLESWPDWTRSLPEGRVVPPTMVEELSDLYDLEYMEDIPYGAEDDAIDLDAFDDDERFGPRTILYPPLIRLARELRFDAPYVDGDYEGAGSPDAFVRDLVGWDGVEHFTGLCLTCDINGSVGFGSLMSDSLIELIELGAFDGFSSLDLTSHYIDGAGIIALSRMEHLRALCLHEVELDTPRLAALASAPEMVCMQRLDLSCHYTDARTLDLRVVSDPDGCAWRHLEHLDLSKRRLVPGSVAALARAPHLSSLRTLAIDGCDVDPDELVALANAPHMRELVDVSR